jgi:tRNA dimethylallyltransferase
MILKNLTQMTSINKKKLWVITGPTAVGKTQLTIDLAKKWKTVIFSCDSRQFYKELSVGTAKPTESEKQGIQHFFIDSHTLNQALTAGQFEKQALELLEKCFQEHNNIILTGGSGLYLNALIFGLDAFPPIDENTKKEVNHLFEEKGLEGLQNKLKELDFETYNKIDLLNPRRIIRALEVSLSSGQPYSGFLQKSNSSRNFDVEIIVLNRERKELYTRINQRVELMITDGLLEEAKKLMPFKELPVLQTVGYQELFPYFKGEYDLDRALELIKQNSRRYAKRQLTWFRKLENARWLHPDAFKSEIGI